VNYFEHFDTGVEVSAEFNIGSEDLATTDTEQGFFGPL
jgi:hypothetical protein